MAARIVRFLLLCITSVIIEQTAAGDADRIRFLIEPSDVIVASQKPTTLSCVVGILDEEVSITWLRNDVEIKPILNQRTIYPNGTLALHKVRKKNNDLGEYRCLAKTSTAALLSRPANVRLAELPPFQKHPENITAYEGETVRFSCQLNSVPAAKISWNFHNKSIDDIADATNNRYDSSIPGVLYIRNVRNSDSGQYWCTGKNPVLSKKEQSAMGWLSVNSGKRTPSSSAVFISPEYTSEKTILENDLLSLECGVGESTNARITWFYKKSKDDPEVFVQNSPYPYSILKKPDIKENETGTYICVVSQADPPQKASRSVYVNVVTPPVVEIEPRSEVLPLALSTRFTCRASGKPQPVVSWLHNGNLLKKDHLDSHRKITENELILTSTVMKDAGIYQCVATNKHGFASAAGQLIINAALKPSSPVRVRCKALNTTTIHVAWAMHDGDESDTQSPTETKEEDEDDADAQGTGGAGFIGMLNKNKSEKRDYSQIAAYTINYYPTDGGSGEIILPTSARTSWMDITDLNAGENYTFYVRTYNVMSGSEPSDKVVCSTLTKDPISLSVLPSKTRANRLPIDLDQDNSDVSFGGGFPLQSSNDHPLNTSMMNDTTVEVSWDFERPNIDDTGFKMILKKSSDSSIVNSTIVNFDDRKILFYNLDPNTSYQVFMMILYMGIEGEITSKSIGPPIPLAPLKPPSNIGTSRETPTSIRLTWDPPNNGVGISYYMVKYSKLGSPPATPETLKTKRTEVMLTNLQPQSAYSIEIQAWDANNRSSSFSVPVLETTPPNMYPVMEGPVAKVKDISSQISSDQVQLSWSDPDSEGHSRDSYYVTYNSSSEPNGVELDADRRADYNFVNIRGLKEGTTYTVRIYSIRDRRKPVGETSFIYDPERRRSPEKPEIVELFGIRLTQEQLIGVYIGVGISVILIILCVIIVCVYKRKFDKHYRQVANNGPHFKPSNEKHEMKVLTRNVNGYRGPMSNGYNNHTTKNAQFPLLTSNCHPRASNGLYHNILVHENRERYDGNLRVIEEEADKLLNNTTNSSVIDETMMSTLDTTNERDHEGGDSGYCDRNHVHSPLNKDSCGENTQRSRKCSDATVDDGFYDSEVASGVHGHSPGRLSSAV